nr:MAG TPA: hypothetical protein [Caudoviricetes sp.]
MTVYAGESVYRTGFESFWGRLYSTSCNALRESFVNPKTLHKFMSSALRKG